MCVTLTRGLFGNAFKSQLPRKDFFSGKTEIRAGSCLKEKHTI